MPVLGFFLAPVLELDFEPASVPAAFLNSLANAENMPPARPSCLPTARAPDPDDAFFAGLPDAAPALAPVLALAAEGMTNRQIATAMGVGTATVKTYFSRAFAKLDVVDRTSAVVEAMRRGEIDA